MEDFFRQLFGQAPEIPSSASPMEDGANSHANSSHHSNGQEANANEASGGSGNTADSGSQQQAPPETPPGAAPPVGLFLFVPTDFIMASMASIFGPMFTVPGDGDAAAAGDGLPDWMSAATAASMAQPQPPQGPPPTAPRALAQLPIVTVTPHDLVEPVNRECCICLSPHELEAPALRLPCAHLLHPDCGRTWLRQHNTCPVCRFELPTECPHYERGRLERMRHRRPRFARHELDRLSVRELKELLRRHQERGQGDSDADGNESRSNNLAGNSGTNGEGLPAPRFHPVDKNDLIEYLIQSRAIDLISSPPPVQYCWKELKNMSVSQLKRCMNDAGVFFSKRDVLEKDDLLRIFVTSGRLVVLSEDEAATASESPQKHALEECQASESVGKSSAAVIVHEPPKEHRSDPRVETVAEDSDAEEDDAFIESDPRSNIDILMEHNDTFMTNSGQQSEITTPVDDASVTGRENISEEDVAISELVDTNTRKVVDVIELAESCRSTSDVQSVDHVRPGATADIEAEDYSANCHNRPFDAMETNLAGEDERRGEGDAVAVSLTGGSLLHVPSPSRKRQCRYDTRSSCDSMPASEDTFDTEECREDDENEYETDDCKTDPNTPIDDSESEIVRRFQVLSINQLQALARECSVDTSNCLEKSDIIDRLVASDTVRNTTSSFDDWGCGEMRALASLVDVDLSNSTCRHEMIRTLQHEVDRRPHAGRYLLALAPLARLTTSQLRSVAREWLVNVSDCLERGEIIHRLVYAAQNR